VVGLRSQEEVLRSFEGLDRVPGSKRPRRPDTETAKKTRNKVLSGSNGWDSDPIIKLVRGEEKELFPISALAQALEKSVVTIRSWEKLGYIPTAPYRLRSKTMQGKKVLGNRVYTRELIEIAVQEFSARGLLGAARVEWSRHDDLKDALIERWRQAVTPEQS
jgi:hypothetical protein